MGDRCPHCQKRFKTILNHLRRSPSCDVPYENARANVASHVPTTIITHHSASSPFNRDSPGTGIFNESQHTTVRQRNTVNYSEGFRKRAKSNQSSDYSIPAADDDLDDYIHTNANFDDSSSADPSRSHQVNDGQRRPITSPNSTLPTHGLIEDHEEAAAESWNSLFTGLDIHDSVAAVAPRTTTAPTHEHPGNQEDEGLAEARVADNRLGVVSNTTLEQQRSMVVVTPSDRSMARLYLLCDKAGGGSVLGRSHYFSVTARNDPEWF